MMQYEEFRSSILRSESLEELIALEQKTSLFFLDDEWYLKQQKDTHQREEAALAAEELEKSYTQEVMVGSASSSLAVVPSGFAWKKFSTAISTVHSELESLCTVCDVCSRDPKRFSVSSPPNDVLQNETEWKNKMNSISDFLDRLHQSASDLHVSPSVLDDEEKLLKNVRIKGYEALACLRKMKEKNEEHNALKKKFLSRLQKLNDWCEKQVLNLEAMQDNPVDMQTYAFDFVGPSEEIVEKLSSLFKSVEKFALEDGEIIAALKDFYEMWLYLLDSLVDRLACMMCELHDTKPLEVLIDECTAYLKRIPTFMGEINQLLEATSVIGSTKEECNAVLVVARGLQDLEKILEQWKERYVLQKASSDLFKQASLSRLTFLPSTEKLVIQSVQRQQEYENVSNELRSWAEEESHSDSWREVYSAIVAIKNRISRLIEKK